MTTGSRTERKAAMVAKVLTLPHDELRGSRLPSGCSLLELLKHLRYVELRWLEWGFQGRDVGDPWTTGVQIAGMSSPRRPAPVWSLERVLFHLLQEYARHLGHLDIVVELATGSIGE
jgi:hypothetical protein